MPGRYFDGLGHEPDGDRRYNGKAHRAERDFKRLNEAQTRCAVAVVERWAGACGRSTVGDVIGRSFQHGNSPEPYKSGTKMSRAV